MMWGCDNVTTLYGLDPESRIVDTHDERRIFSWLICRTFDDKGNLAVYSYVPEDDDGLDLSQAAQEWYGAKLGLKPDHIEEVGQGLWYQTGGGWFYLYPTTSAGTAQNTAAGWTVTDLEAVVEELRERDVVFENYDFGEMTTENGVLNAPGDIQGRLVQGQ